MDIEHTDSANCFHGSTPLLNSNGCQATGVNLREELSNLQRFIVLRKLLDLFLH